MKLEELARQSSDAARASVVHLDPPPIGEDPGRSSWHIPALVGVATLVLVAGVAAALLFDGGSDDGDGEGEGESIVAGSQDVPRLGLPELSSWNITGAIELSAFNEEIGPQPVFDYYGKADADDPFAEGDLLIVTMADATAEDLSSGGAQEVAVRGLTGFAVSGGEAGGGLPPDITLLQWIEPVGDGQTGIALGSRSMTLAELQQAAEGLDVSAAASGEPVVRPASDLGFERVSSSSGSPFSGRSAAIGSDAPGWLVAYEQASTDMPGSLILVTGGGDLRETAAELRFWNVDFRSVTVNDSTAFEATSGPAVDGITTVIHTVAWSPAPGTVATLTYAGPDVEFDVVGLAETAAVLDDAAWEQAKLLAEEAESPATDYDVVFGEGSGVLGETPYSWVLGLRGNDDLCIDIQIGSSGTGSCRSFSELQAQDLEVARSIDNGFGEDVVSALIVGTTDVEAVRETSGVGVIERVDAADRSWFVYIGDPGHQPEFDVIVDGEVVDTFGADVVEEAALPVPPVDVASHPGAQEIGIAENFVPIINVVDSNLTLVVGTADDRTCVVEDVPLSGAWCSPGDVVQFRDIEARGAATALVVATSPPCVTGPAMLAQGGIGVDPIGFGDGPDATTLTAWYVTNALSEMTVSVVDNEGIRHSLTITDDAAEGAQTDVTFVDSASWPDTLCH